MEHRVLVIAVDEVGVSALAGPIVAGAVVYDFRNSQAMSALNGIQECKLLSKRRGKVGICSWFEKIQKSALVWACTQVGPLEIEATNVKMAALDCMAKAIRFSMDILSSLSIRDLPEAVLIDGPNILPLERYKLAKLNQVPIPSGDRLRKSIAAASIVGRFFRDGLMEDMHANRDDWKPYNFADNKGYRTEEHLEAIRKNGCSHYHRYGFSDVRREVAEHAKSLPL